MREISFPQDVSGPRQSVGGPRQSVGGPRQSVSGPNMLKDRWPVWRQNSGNWAFPPNEPGVMADPVSSINFNMGDGTAVNNTLIIDNCRIDRYLMGLLEFAVKIP